MEIPACRARSVSALLDLRAASNFDREAPDQTAAESLTARSGGYLPSVSNAYRVAGALAQTIVADWDDWSAGPPK